MRRAPLSPSPLRARDFSPPHCPWPACPSHREPAGSRPRFLRHGHYRRLSDRRLVPRFRCLACRRTFSTQTFAFSYYLKRPELSVGIAAGLVAGSAHRQIARSLGCAPQTVTRRSARLGRHALLANARALAELGALEEPVVYDHFETFVFGQDFPLGLGTAVGSRSWFVYDLEPAPHGRRGRMSPRQKARQRRMRHRWGPPPRGTYGQSLARLLDRLLPLVPAGRSLCLVSDDHPAYGPAVRRHPGGGRVRHHAFPNPARGPKGSPRSAVARARDEALFPVDLLHGLLRHSNAHHRRETIAFSRRSNALLERAHLTAFWRNFIKRRTERRPAAETPAMHLGLALEPWTWGQVLTRRLFPWRERIPPGWEKVYRREIQTPQVGRNHRHELSYAF